MHCTILFLAYIYIIMCFIVYIARTRTVFSPLPSYLGR